MKQSGQREMSDLRHYLYWMTMTEPLEEEDSHERDPKAGSYRHRRR